jgi:hypothetical protein
MITLTYWVKWGLVGAASHLALSLVLGAVERIWYFYDLFWYHALIIVDYPAAVFHRWILGLLRMPSMYDAPLPLYETLTIKTSGHVLGCAWWFLLGALLAVTIHWFRATKRHLG